jgi:integrase
MVFSNLRRTVQGRCRQAHVRELSPNEFRHSAATLLIEADVPIHQVADMLGHKDTRMLAKHYRHKRGVVDVTDGQERMLGEV